VNRHERIHRKIRKIGKRIGCPTDPKPF